MEQPPYQPDGQPAGQLNSQPGGQPGGQPVGQPGGQPYYTPWGARPRPVPHRQSARSGWRGSLILLAVMFGWVIFVTVLAAAAAPSGSAAGASVPVGLGVTVTPAGGWYSAADRWNVGPNAVSLQKSGALVAFAAETFAGANEDLLAEQTGYLKTDFASYRELPVSSTTMAGDIPALKVLFSGVADSSRVEGELVVATTGGTGVVMLAVASPGQLSEVQRDLDRMLQTLEVPR